MFYMRCKDQPLLNETATKKRNKNMNSFQFPVKKVNNPVKITKIVPNNTKITSGVVPVSVEFEVTTSGGIDDGKAMCYFKSGSNWVKFFSTDAKVHNQTLESFNSGAHRLELKCEDRVGNYGLGASMFSVELDNRAPNVARVYQQNGNLIVISDENAECFISTLGCDFNIAEAVKMEGIEKIHSFAFNKTISSYVKCKDNFGNYPGLCSIAVSGGKIE